MAIVAGLLGAGAIVAGAATKSRRTRAGRRRHGDRRRRSGAPQPARLSAQRRNDGRPLGVHLSRGDRPVGQGHAEDVRTASRTRCRCRARGSTPIRSAIRCRATASPIWRTARQASPYFDTSDSPTLQAAARHDARQDRRVHAGSGCRGAAVPQGSAQPRRPVRRRHVHLSVRQSALGAEEGRCADQGSSRRTPISRSCAATS